MTEVIFDEDRTLLHQLPSEIKIPDTGFEGWFYKKFPGSYYFKKALLIGIIAILFGASLIIFSLGRFNIQQEQQTFEQRIINKNDR